MLAVILSLYTPMAVGGALPSCAPYTPLGCGLPQWGQPLTADGAPAWWAAGYGWVATQPADHLARVLWPTEAQYNVSFARYKRQIAPLLPPLYSLEAREQTSDELRVLSDMQEHREAPVYYEAAWPARSELRLFRAEDASLSATFDAYLDRQGATGGADGSLADAVCTPTCACPTPRCAHCTVARVAAAASPPPRRLRGTV